jgi:hypothetical protein
MTLRTFTLNDVDLDVYFKLTKENDPCGTGDSPAGYDVDIFSIETLDSSTNIQMLLSDVVIDRLYDLIIEDSENDY